VIWMGVEIGISQSREMGRVERDPQNSIRRSKDKGFLGSSISSMWGFGRRDIEVEGLDLHHSHSTVKGASPLVAGWWEHALFSNAVRWRGQRSAACE